MRSEGQSNKAVDEGVYRGYDLYFLPELRKLVGSLIANEMQLRTYVMTLYAGGSLLLIKQDIKACTV